MPCKDCKYFDENDNWGYKGYCSYYRKYYDPDDKICSHYSAGDSGGCFLTTACCAHKNMPDDCYELSMLRKYRDSFLKSTPEGKKLVDEYYEIAPKLVEKINQSENKDKVYDFIYSEIVQCVSMVEQGKNDEVCEKYKALVFSLKDQYFV